MTLSPSIRHQGPFSKSLLFLIVQCFTSLSLSLYYHYHYHYHTPNANMADRSVGAQVESNESKVSQSSMFCFDIASPEKSCFVVDLVCFISLCLRFAVFLNTTRRDVNLPPFAS